MNETGVVLTFNLKHLTKQQKIYLHKLKNMAMKRMWIKQLSPAARKRFLKDTSGEPTDYRPGL